jgi:hypothetical protein
MLSMQNSMKMNARVLPLLTWHICRIIVNSLGPIVSTCILNQFKRSLVIK